MTLAKTFRSDYPIHLIYIKSLLIVPNDNYVIGVQLRIISSKSRGKYL